MLNNKVTSTICQGTHGNATMSVKHLLYFVSKMYNNNNPPNGSICAHFLPGPRYLEYFQCSMPKNAINIFTLVHSYFNTGVGTSQNCGVTHIMWLFPPFNVFTSENKMNIEGSLGGRIDEWEEASQNAHWGQRVEGPRGVLFIGGLVRGGGWG